MGFSFDELFHISHDCELKIYSTGKISGKICLKAIRDVVNMWLIYVFQYVVCDQGRDRGTHFPALVGHLNLPIRKTQSRLLGVLTAMILKRVSESIFFQSNKFTACKVKEEKEVANSLMALNLLKIIRLFQGKKHLRT